MPSQMGHFLTFYDVIKYCKAVISVCTGTFLLHRAGLLSGKKKTTHWNSLRRLRELGDVAVVEERFVRDGNIWSSAGVAAGMDLTLALIAAIAGEEIAGRVQLAAEYYPALKRYGAAHKAPMAPAYLKAEDRQGIESFGNELRHSSNAV